MANLSISAAWNEATAFVGREARLLLPISFLLLVLPGIVLQVLAPGAARPGMVAQPSPWVLLAFLPIAFASIIGSVALCRLALRPGTAVGEALQVGVRRFLPVFGATLLLVLALFVALVPLALLLGIGTPVVDPGRVALLAMVLLLAGAYLGGRMLLMTPSASVEPTGPIGMIGRSWRLTAPYAWKLFGLMLLLFLAYLLIALAVGLVGGLVIVLLAGRPDPGTLPALLLVLLNGALQTVIWIYFFSLTSRIYAQLAAPTSSDVFA